EGELETVEDLLAALLERRFGPGVGPKLRAEAQTVELELAGLSLQGRIWAQAGCGLYATVSKLDGKHFHRAWVQSLVWRRVHGSDAPFIAAGEGLGLEFPPLSSTEIDEELLR